MKKAAVFETTYKDYLAQIAEIDALSRAERLGAEVRDNALVIPLYGDPYGISEDGVFHLSTGKRANFAVSVLLCKYVIQCPEQVPVTGDWVTYREFRDAGPLVGYFTTNTNKIIETTFSGKMAKLKAACEKLGGAMTSDDASYDLSATFVLLPRIPVYFRFNDRDDEFPAQCTVLFRQSTQAYLDMESLAIGGTLLTGRLIGTPDV